MARSRIKCAWCGTPVQGKPRCQDCTRKLRWYKEYCRDTHKNSDTKLLLAFRNLIIDLKYNMPGATLLPDDLDYQLDRVSRYLAKETD